MIMISYKSDLKNSYSEKYSVRSLERMGELKVTYDSTNLQTRYTAKVKFVSFLVTDRNVIAV